MPSEKNKPQEYCPDCGKIIIEGKKFCSYCGYEKKSDHINSTGETNKLINTCLTCNKPVPSNKKYCPVCEIKRIVTIRSKSGDLISGKYCPTCGKEISSWENTCNHCSQKDNRTEPDKIQESQLCDKCGNPVGTGKSICPFCGYRKTNKLTDVEKREKKFSSAQYCSKCGEELEAGKETCIFCGYDMRKPPDENLEGDFDKDITVGLVMPVIEETDSDKEYCKSCGEEIGRNGICPFCGYGKTRKIIDKKEEIYRPDKTYIPEKLIPLEPDKIPAMVEKVLSTPSADIPAMLETVLSESVPENKTDISRDVSVAGKGGGKEVKDEQSKEEYRSEEDKTDRTQKPSGTGFLSVSLKVSHVIYLSIAMFTVLILSIFGVIYALKFSNKGNVSATPAAIHATPVITPAVVAMDTPVKKTTPSPKPVKEATRPPVTEVKPTNVVPTQPVYIETPVLSVVVPTKIPTRRPVRYKTPGVNTGYIPSYTATPQVDYKTSNRIYCDNAISNKIVPLYNERRYSEAIAECNYLLSLDQNYYMNYIWMASCYLALKDPADAKYYIDMAWKLEWNEKRTPYEQSESRKLYDWYRSEGGN